MRSLFHSAWPLSKVHFHCLVVFLIDHSDVNFDVSSPCLLIYARGCFPLCLISFHGCCFFLNTWQATWHFDDRANWCVTNVWSLLFWWLQKNVLSELYDKIFAVIAVRHFCHCYLGAWNVLLSDAIVVNHVAWGASNDFVFELKFYNADSTCGECVLKLIA